MATYRFPPKQVEQGQNSVDMLEKAMPDVDTETDEDKKKKKKKLDDKDVTVDPDANYKLESPKPDEMEKADSGKGDDESAPEFDDADYEESEELKACKAVILAAYDAWVKSKQGQEITGEYEWAKALPNEKPKDFAERAAIELMKDEKHKDVAEDLGGEEEFTDYVEAVMRYEGPESETLAKSFESLGMFAVEDVMIKGDGPDSYLTGPEAMELIRIRLMTQTREYAAKPTKREWNYSVPGHDFCVEIPDAPGDFVERTIENHINDLVWGQSTAIAAMREAGGVQRYIDFIANTIWSTLVALSVIESVPEFVLSAV